MSIDIFTDVADSDSSIDHRQGVTSAGANGWMMLTVVASLLAVWMYWPTTIDLDPNPDIQSGFRVLVVEETEKRAELSDGQRQALFSVDVREWLDANCVKEDGQPARLFLDSQTDPSSYGDAWGKLRQRATPPYPCVVTSHPPDVKRHDIRRDFNHIEMIELLRRAKQTSKEDSHE